MSPSPLSLKKRVRFLLQGRSALREQAAAHALAHYRRHRRLPPAYVTRLLSAPSVRRIRLRGEIEHVLRVAGILSAFDRWRKIP
jgi:hypothetical protein